MRTVYVPDAEKFQKRTEDALRLELQTIVIAWNQTFVLCNRGRGKCS